MNFRKQRTDYNYNDSSQVNNSCVISILTWLFLCENTTNQLFR